MLVCNVSLRPPRRAIASEIVEAIAATDALETGNVVFATLVDDPASVAEIVDAYLGEIMLEAAGASDTLSASIPATYTAAINETATAADTQDGTSAVATVTWDPATVTNVTLSGGNLVATNTGTTSADQGARVSNANGKTAGKYYYEVTTTASIGGGNRGHSVATTATTYSSQGSGGSTTGVIMFINGAIYAGGTATGVAAGGVGTAGDVCGIAVDLDNRKIWFRKAPSGNWNGNASYNPATNVGGVNIPAGTMVPFVTFGGGGGAANNVWTANFGAAAFSGAVPSGFTSGWPV